MKILIIEDENPLALMLQSAINRAGYVCELIHDGKEGLKRALDEDIQVIVLDLSLPGMDGLQLLRKLRDEKVVVPVLVLTARGETAQRIEGLYQGADDYMAKPCDPDEVAARVHALVRRSSGRAGHFTVGELELDPLTRSATRAGKRLDLTSREFVLLETLARSAGTPLTRSQILERVFGYRFQPETNIVEVHIKNLRRKVDARFDTPLIHTVMKVGYVLRPVGTPSNA